MNESCNNFGQRPMDDKQLFPQFKEAVIALSKCCGPKEDHEIPPIARSEVYNETWMLRLTLALLHDSKLDFSKIKNMKKQNALKLMQDALQRNWISEGGLEPVFEREGTTWADAVLGNVERKEDTKRGVKAANTQIKPSFGIVVVEAKLGSSLSPGTDHYSDYNQAARNIACLANLVRNKAELLDKSVFVILAPKEIIDKSQNLITDAPEIIRTIDKTKMRDTIESYDDFLDAVNKISEKSVAMSWDQVIDALNCDIGHKNFLINEFYTSAKGEMKKQK